MVCRTRSTQQRGNSPEGYWRGLPHCNRFDLWLIVLIDLPCDPMEEMQCSSIPGVVYLPPHSAPFVKTTASTRQDCVPMPATSPASTACAGWYATAIPA